ncbi:MAG: hypothetical protein JSS86_14855 [Cyanobacteria bacterium SZAS LIN-2]|nr:hypothetical protein [Cyanobacteria bacterium SZAS LIN-2]
MKKTPVLSTLLALACSTPGVIAAENDFSILQRIDTAPTYGLPSLGNAAKPVNGKARSLMNFVFDTRGTDWSKEGADVAIDTTSDVTSDTTAFYRDQVHRDELHWQVVSLIARIASGLGDHAGESQSAIKSVSQLRGLIGDVETDAVMTWLSGPDIEHARSKIPQTSKFDLPHILDAQDVMLTAALDRDSVISDVKKELSPYANKSKGKRTATKIAYSTLGVAAFVPNLIAPIAETSFLGTMMANGGPEQDKLLKEIYYAKRLEKRRDLIQRQLNLALNTREISLATANAPLYHFSRRLTQYLCGEDIERQLFPEEDGQLGSGPAPSLF